MRWPVAEQGGSVRRGSRGRRPERRCACCQRSDLLRRRRKSKSCRLGSSDRVRSIPMGMSGEQQAVTPRFDGVDVLRGLSILSVILLHTWIRMHFPGSLVNQVMRGQLAHLLLRNGDNGVTVFFAVSGFLITLTSLRRFGSLGRAQPGEVYRIRFLCIAPLFLLLCFVVTWFYL